VDKKVRAVLVTTCFAALQASGVAQDQPAPSDPATAEKKGEWLFAPIPVNSPAIGGGFQWAVARVFPFNKRDEVSPPSVVGVGGLFTNNGSKGIVVGGRLYLKEDRYRITAAVGSASINFDIYGTGTAAGNRGTFVPLNTEGGGGIGEFLFRVRKSVYVGARGQFRNLSVALDQERMSDSEITTQPPEQIAAVIEQIRTDFLRQKTSSLGPRFQWDTRDSVFYPKKGFLMEVASDFFAEGLGSKWSYQYYKASFNKYNRLSDNQVIAFRGMGCAAAGDHVPIYDLCLFGTMNDLRGYPGGRFQDRRMFATQAEYRLMFPVKGFLGRFGMVAFAGVGGVGDKFSNFAFDELLPAGGGGLRFRALKRYPINFRIDYGIGRVGNTLSIGILEAF
jgi:outer membrane protein assembly factor BamA